MIKTVDGQNYYVGVFSHARPQNVPKVQSVMGVVTWYVKDDKDVEEYEKHGAMFIQKVKAKKNPLVAARNAVLEDGFELNLPTVIAADDLNGKFLGDFHFTGRGNAAHGRSRKTNLHTPINLEQLLGKVAERKEIYDFPYHSVLHHTDYTSFNHLVRIDRLVSGDFGIVWPSDIRYDPELEILEDVDFMLQHMKKYGGLVQHRDITINHVPCRTDQFEADRGGIDYNKVNYRETQLAFAKKWGTMVKWKSDKTWDVSGDFSVLMDEKYKDEVHKKIDFYGTKSEAYMITEMIDRARIPGIIESETVVLLRLLVTHP